MLRYCLLLILLCFITITNAQVNYPYPELRAVVETFGNNYSYNSTSRQLKLARKPEGWVVYEISFNNYPIIEKVSEQVFWSKQLGEFVRLDFGETENEYRDNRYDDDYYEDEYGYEEEEQDIELVQQNSNPLETEAENNAYNFERNYYYGYPGWEKDVINELSVRNDLTDSLLESLARAYSARAGSFITNSEFYFEPPAFYRSEASDISANEADSFSKYADSAIATYKKLNAFNPYYETMVGNIYIKHCNEYMYAYTELMANGYPAKAKKYLVPGLYGKAFLSLVKNYFHSVDQNGILITNGDNDTYPLLYLQLVESYRKDVRVINYSLLNLGRFIKLYQKGYGTGVLPVKMDLAPHYYYDDPLNYLSVTNSDYYTNASSVTEFFEWIKARNNRSNRRALVSIPEQGLELRVNKTNCFKNKLGPKKLMADSIFLQVENGLFKGDIALLDIIYTNNWAVNIYLANSMTTGSYTPYIKCTGLAGVLTPFYDSTGGNNNLDTTRMYTNLITKFSVNTNDRFAGKKGQGFRHNREWLIDAYSKLALYYFNKNDRAKFIAVMDKALSIVPASYTPYDGNYSGFVGQLVQIQMNKKADELAVKICDGLLSIADEKHLIKYHNALYANNKYILSYTISGFEQLADTYKLESLKLKMKEYREKVK